MAQETLYCHRTARGGKTMTTHESAIADYFLHQARVYLLEYHTWRGRVPAHRSLYTLENARVRLNMARTWLRIAGAL